MYLKKVILIEPSLNLSLAPSVPIMDKITNSIEIEDIIGRVGSLWGYSNDVRWSVVLE